jgi:hypothetical protein
MSDIEGIEVQHGSVRPVRVVTANSLTVAEYMATWSRPARTIEILGPHFTILYHWPLVQRAWRCPKCSEVEWDGCGDDCPCVIRWCTE